MNNVKSQAVAELMDLVVQVMSVGDRACVHEMRERIRQLPGMEKRIIMPSRFNHVLQHLIKNGQLEKAGCGTVTSTPYLSKFSTYNKKVMFYRRLK